MHVRNSEMSAADGLELKAITRQRKADGSHGDQQRESNGYCKKSNEGLMKAMKISRKKLTEATKMSRGTDGHYEDQLREPSGHKDEQRGAGEIHEDEQR